MNNLNPDSYREGKNDVTFKSFGVDLAGDLYLPEGFDASKKYMYSTTEAGMAVSAMNRNCFQQTIAVSFF